jgi:hypothetical protein
MRQSGSLESIIEALHHEDPNVRWEAARALGVIRDPRAVEPLIAALGDRDPDVRRKAALSLAKIRDLRAVDPLLASAEGGTLTEHNCAIRAVAERFPEICAAEERFLSAALGASVGLQAHVLDGCSACEYQVQFTAPVSIGTSRPQGVNA